MSDFLRMRRGTSATATSQIKEWVRQEFGLGSTVQLLVCELTCTEPGCPPLETSIAILAEGSEPEERKVHKALSEVTSGDIAQLASRAQAKGDEL